MYRVCYIESDNNVHLVRTLYCSKVLENCKLFLHSQKNYDNLYIMDRVGTVVYSIDEDENEDLRFHDGRRYGSFQSSVS